MEYVGGVGLWHMRYGRGNVTALGSINQIIVIENTVQACVKLNFDGTQPTKVIAEMV